MSVVLWVEVLEEGGRPSSRFSPASHAIHRGCQEKFRACSDACSPLYNQLRAGWRLSPPRPWRGSQQLGHGQFLTGYFFLVCINGVQRRHKVQRNSLHSKPRVSRALWPRTSYEHADSVVATSQAVLCGLDNVSSSQSVDTLQSPT